MSGTDRAMSPASVGYSDFELITTRALRDNRPHARAVWSQAAKDRLYARMFPDQTGQNHDVPRTTA